MGEATTTGSWKYILFRLEEKWYWSIFTRILDMAVANSFVLHRLIHGSNSISIKDFGRAIATTYLKLGHGSRVMRERPLSFSSTSRKQVAHDICLDQRNHMLGKRDKQRHCQYQSCKGKPLTYCIKCRVTLCVSCFPKYHQ